LQGERNTNRAENELAITGVSTGTLLRIGIHGADLEEPSKHGCPHSAEYFLVFLKLWVFRSTQLLGYKVARKVECQQLRRRAHPQTCDWHKQHKEVQPALVGRAIEYL